MGRSICLARQLTHRGSFMPVVLLSSFPSKACSDNFPTSELATVLRHHTSRLLVHQQKETEAFLRLLFRFFLSLSLSPRDKRENLKIKSKMVADNIVVLADSS